MNRATPGRLCRGLHAGDRGPALRECLARASLKRPKALWLSDDCAPVMAVTTVPGYGVDMSIGDERYINLESFKRDGSGVRTPVWCADCDGKVVVFTAADSFKVKRVRRNPRVRVAKCDVRGKVLGPWHEGACIIVDDNAQQQRAYAALRSKYGFQMKLLDFFSKLAGKKDKRAVLAITLEE